MSFRIKGDEEYITPIGKRLDPYTITTQTEKVSILNALRNWRKRDERKKEDAQEDV